MSLDWKARTRATIEHLRGIFALDPTLTDDDKLLLYAQAFQITGANTLDPKFWGRFTNVLRVLVAAQAPQVDLTALYAHEETPDQ